MRAPLTHTGGWSPSQRPEYDPMGNLNTSNLLKWISDITIKRRQIRKTTRCGNLFAEAILSSALRKARKELASKLEAKKKKLQRFSSRLRIRYSTKKEEDSQVQDENRVTFCKSDLVELSISEPALEKIKIKEDVREDLYNLTVKSYSWKESSTSLSDIDPMDADVQACLLSLDSFFNELKSIKA